MFYEDGNASNTLVRLQGYTQCALGSKLNVDVPLVCSQENSTGHL